MHTLNITTFFQLRIFPTGKFLVLSNSSAVYSLFESEQGIGNYFSHLIENSLHHITVNLWSSSPVDQFLTRLHELNIYQGVSFSYALDEYVDIFSFATNQVDEKILNVYLNNLSLLKRFIVYFRFKTEKILARKTAKSFSQKNELNLSKNLPLDNLAGITRFKNKLLSCHIEATLLKSFDEKIELTEKEKKYLGCLLEGKSIKMMANELNVSRRTVEAYLKSIKNKTGLYTNDQLISIFNQDVLMEIL